MSLPMIETERLTIREYSTADLDARHQLMTTAFGFDITIEETDQWLDWTVRNYRALANLHQPPYGDYAAVLKPSGLVIGSIGLVPSIIPWGIFDNTISANRRKLVSPEFGLFWAILPDYQGNGYAVEVAQGLIRFVFDHVHAQRVVATTEHDNLASQRVMDKLGMTLHRNSAQKPFWLQVVGVLEHPEIRERQSNDS